MLQHYEDGARDDRDHVPFRQLLHFKCEHWSRQRSRRYCATWEDRESAVLTVVPSPDLTVGASPCTAHGVSGPCGEGGRVGGVREVGGWVVWVNLSLVIANVGCVAA